MDTNRQYEIEDQYIEPEVYEDQQPFIDNRSRNKQIFKIKWALITVFFFAMFIGIDVAHVWYHEKVHAAIYDMYGISYTHGWKFEGAIIAFYVQSDDISNCDVVCRSLQMENEIIAYNQAQIYYSLWMILFLYLLKCIFDDIRKEVDAP